MSVFKDIMTIVHVCVVVRSALSELLINAKCTLV